jgi:DNA-binding winged helix-turn-helix (wHTH) protein/tetratricopeptide (TPR) repeat protein
VEFRKTFSIRTLVPVPPKHNFPKSEIRETEKGLYPQSSRFRDHAQIAFDTYRIDIADEVLWRGCEKIPLKMKPFAFLAYLARHPGRLVTKDELMGALWSDRNVCDDALKHCVTVIRKALGDDAKAPRFIETAHGRGYRFIGKIDESPIADGISRERDSSANPPLLVGRDTELAQLRCFLERTLEGVRQVVFVTGEQGIGKTALVNAFLSMISSELHIGEDGSNLVTRGQCLEFHGASAAYMPVLEALTHISEGPGRDRLVNAFHLRAPLWLAQIPALRGISGPKLLQPLTMSATRKRELGEIIELLEALSANNLLILVFEDLHWSDHSTLNMISYVAQRRTPAKLMMICTYRPEAVLANDHPLPAIKQKLRAQMLCQELPLGFLDESDMGKYLASRFPRNDFPVQIGPWIHRKTEGNPLFMVSVIDHLLTQGAIARQDGHWSLYAEVESFNMGVPATIQQMIKSRIESCCSEVEQLILEAGSVEGLSFSTATLAAALDTEVDLVEVTCENLSQRNRFLQPDGIRQLSDGRLASRYRFAHSLFQSVCYQRILENHRAMLHRCIGEHIEREYGNHEGLAANLAMHFERGSEYGRAIKYYKQAADNANRRYAEHEALELARRGLRLIDRVPNSPERTQQELGLKIALGIALKWTQGYGGAETEDVFAQAENLCAQCGESTRLYPASMGLWHSCTNRAEFEKALDLARQLLRLAQSRQDPCLLSEAHLEMGVTLMELGELTSALRNLEQGIACWDVQKPGSHQFWYARDPGIACRSFLAWVKLKLGYPDQALEEANQALALAENTGRVEDSIFARTFVARIHLDRGESKPALEYAKAGMAVAHEHGWALLAAYGSSFYGWALAREGRVNEGIVLIRKALTEYREVGSTFLQAEALAILAQVLREAGQIEEALTVAERGTETVRGTGMRRYEAELFALKGDLLVRRLERIPQNNPHLVTSDQQESEACFQHAIEMARCQQAKMIELRAMVGLARLWQKQNRHSEARQRLAEIYDCFTEGHNTSDLKDAYALLQQLS